MPRTFGLLWPLAVVLFLALVAGPSWAQQTPPSPVLADGFQAGREYEEIIGPGVLFEPDDGRIEVLSYFWFNCSSCYAIDPEMHQWAAKLPADVRFIRLPATFNPAVSFHGRIYYTLKELGLGYPAEKAVFDEFRLARKPINQPEQLPELARLLNVDKNKFITTFNSPEIDKLMAAAEKSMDDYDLPGVPAMVIDGRYRFDIGTAHGPEGYKKLAEYLIDKRRQERQRNKAPKQAGKLTADQ